MDANNLNKIIKKNLEQEMKESFISYAMSVIASRALPDVRDGLKPVHRRILYAMNELNLQPQYGYKKSARITGDTMGKYHPHGNSSIYDAMVRMAQDFSMRYTLVDGHGNFGSIDGDSAAAERYTEAKLSKMAVYMLSDIDKETVDFMPTYDEESIEPVVLPARFPNLLVNGTSGIAVGMATNIPPHNLSEIVDAINLMIDNYIKEDRETDLDEIIDIIKGPDFPTGATILGVNGIKSAYRTGKGRIIIRAKASIEEFSNNRQMIVIREIPYQVNKARLVEKIADLVKDKKIEGISDLRDESNRHGIRIVIELKKDANANVILNKLYKYSQLQDTFSINMLALVDNEPKVLNLKQIIKFYLEHQIEIIKRRTQFDLNKALKRSHILEGYLIAINNIDTVINIIKSSKSTSDAKLNLIDKFELSDEQSNAIVEMRLKSLTGLEKEKIENELNDLLKVIKNLQSILNDKKMQYEIIKDELLAIKDKFGDERRTDIEFDDNEINFEDLIDDESTVITMSYLDYVKRMPLNMYKSQNRGGRGIIGMQTKEDDVVKNLFVTNTHSNLLYFTNKGKVFMNKAYDIPEATRTSRGIALVNLLNLSENEKITTVIPIQELNKETYFIMVTKKGVIKKIALSLFKSIKKSGVIALTIRDDDELISVINTKGDSTILLATKNGLGIRFKEDTLRASGRNAMGVKAIRLDEDDYIIGAQVLEKGNKILFVSENGFGKCTEIDEFRIQNRGGKGLRIYKVTNKTGSLVGICSVSENEEVMIITSEGIIIRLRISDISTFGRIAQGVKLVSLKDNIKVVSTAKISEDKINKIDDQEIFE